MEKLLDFGEFLRSKMLGTSIASAAQTRLDQMDPGLLAEAEHELAERMYLQKTAMQTRRDQMNPGLPADARRLADGMYLQRSSGLLPSLVEGNNASTTTAAIVVSITEDHLEEFGTRRPSLIITQDGAHWRDKLLEQAPGVRVRINEGTPHERAAILGSFLASSSTQSQVLITSYTLAIKDTKALRNMLWGLTVWDDAVVRLRKGWRDGSPTFRLVHSIVGGNRNVAGNDVGIIVRVPSRVSNFDDAAFLLQSLMSRVYDGFHTFNVAAWASSITQLSALGLGNKRTNAFLQAKQLEDLQIVMDQVFRPSSLCEAERVSA
mmetsp:Transcript_11028/g.18816  ORF Transcript_11028/g.18816 Transcript_11028/m.18816 type:complete len:320 (+) Transcript_11028:263-1222(+)